MTRNKYKLEFLSYDFYIKQSNARYIVNLDNPTRCSKGLSCLLDTFPLVVLIVIFQLWVVRILSTLGSDVIIITIPQS